MELPEFRRKWLTTNMSMHNILKCVECNGTFTDYINFISAKLQLTRKFRTLTGPIIVLYDLRSCIVLKIQPQAKTIEDPSSMMYNYISFSILAYTSCLVYVLMNSTQFASIPMLYGDIVRLDQNSVWGGMRRHSYDVILKLIKTICCVSNTIKATPIINA